MSAKTEDVEEARDLVGKKTAYATAMADMLRSQDPELAAEHERSARLMNTLLASHAAQAERIASLEEVMAHARSLLEDEDRMHPIGCSAWREFAFVVASEIDALLSGKASA